MKKIALSRGLFALVDDDDYEFLNQWKWYARKDRHNYYALRNDYKRLDAGVYYQKTIFMHRLIMAVSESHILVDHRDNDGLNNQKNNLRICTHQENSMNKKKRVKSSSVYKGVTWHKRIKRWEAQIQFKGKHYHLGFYDVESEAADAYDSASKKHHGDFAKNNIKK